MTVEQIAGALERFRLPRYHEADFHAAVLSVLTEAGVVFESERDLGPAHGRVDVFVPTLGLGIELKVKGALSHVTAQLHRYALSAEVRRLMLVTGSARLGRLPATLNGKPITVVSTWRGYL